MFATRTSLQNALHVKKPLACRFSLLVWNLHKENQTEAFKKKFHTLMQSYPSDILLFQEVKYPKRSTFFFCKHAYFLVANIETKHHCYGVCTATNFTLEMVQDRRTTKKEFGFATHKSLLITKHQICNNKMLHIVNLHAINFVSHKIFADELKKITTIIAKLDGALIVAGDFNSWSKKRFALLQAFQKELSLEKLEPENPHHIKHIFSQEIDHIYYRDIKVLHAVAIDTKNISDHNPLYGEFEVVL